MLLNMCKSATHHTPKLNFLLVLEQTQGLNKEHSQSKNILPHTNLAKELRIIAYELYMK